jgi:hypothetical protein
MEKAQHCYKQLQRTDTIRILTLDPGKRNDPLAGKLEAEAVDSATDYEALSYVWADLGPSNCVYELLIHNEEYREGWLALSGGSIFAALRQLRHPDQTRRIWADQCCIDQANAAERSQQIKFMHRIYRDADHVWAWLGLDPDNEAESVFSLIQELDHSLNGASYCQNIGDLERLVRDNRNVLHSLTGRPWVRQAETSTSGAF